MISTDFHILGDPASGFQIRSKNETIIVEFTNDIEKEIFVEIINLLNENKRLDTIADIKWFIGNKYPEENILNVIKELKDFKVWEDKIEKSPDSLTDISKEQLLFWKNSEYEGVGNYQQKISLAKIALIGNSKLREFLKPKLIESGFKSVNTINTPMLSEAEEIQQFKDEVLQANDFIIVDAENWSPHFLDIFNKISYELNKPWLLIRGIDNSRGSIGPLFFGKNTGCYQCFHSRIKSNLEFLPYFNEYEKFLIQNKFQSRGSAGPIAFYDLLASIAVLETLKFISEWTIPIVYKSFLMVDMYTYEVKTHPFLKAPVCPVCHPKLEFKIAPWLEPIVLNGIK
jgi:thiazole/oxazole-forming peptide maturase SagC family component